MDLTSGQLSSLNEMAIPVWALRTENIEQQTSDTNEQLLHSDCFILLESYSDNQQAQRLLQAMLFSIGLQPDQYVIISSDQLPQLQSLPAMQQKLLLVLGESFAQSLWGKSVMRGQIHKMLDTSIATMVSFSLDELLAAPENKALAWQDLQLVRHLLNKS